MKDLSELAKGSLSMGCSMAGGNTLSDNPAFSPPGSLSEQAADLPFQPTHNSPELELGPNSDKQLTTKVNDAGSLHQGGLAWKKVT